MSRQIVFDSTVQPIMNLHQTPLPGPTVPASTANLAGVNNSRWFGGGSGAGTYTAVSSATSNPFAPWYVRKTWTVAGNGNGDTGFDIHPRAGAGVSQYIPVQPGEVYSAIGFLRPSPADKVCQMSWYFYDTSNTQVQRLSTGNYTMAANRWNPVYGTITVPSGVNAAYMKVCVDVTTGGAVWAANDTLDYAGSALYKGSIPAIYYDGNAPGWQWTGADNMSESVGYPASKNLIADSDFSYIPQRAVTQVANEENMSAYYHGEVRVVNLGGTDGLVLECTANDTGSDAQYGGPTIGCRRWIGNGGKWSGLPVVRSGDTFRASCQIKAATAIASGVGMGMRYTDAAQNYIGEATASFDIPTTWTTISMTHTAGSTHYGAFPNFEFFIKKGITGIGQGFIVYVRNVQVEYYPVGSSPLYIAGVQEAGVDGGNATFGAQETVFARAFDGGQYNDTVYNDLVLDGGSV